MATRVVVRGQVWYADREAREQLVLRQKAREALAPADRHGEPLTGMSSPSRGVAGASAPLPFRAGVGFRCPEDRLDYRIVSFLDPAGGWATTAFWQKRWRLTHGGILELARNGLLDAAMLECSQVRRFRCRDEASVLASDVVARAALKRRREAQDTLRGDSERAGGVASSPRTSPARTRRAGSPRRVDGRWVVD